MERPERPNDFLRAIEKPRVRVPDPEKDFGMYSQMDVALHDLHGYLDSLRSNQGRVGYTGQNLMSDLSKAYIEAVQRGDKEEQESIQIRMKELSHGFDNAVSDGTLAGGTDNFSRTMWQEHMEAELFGAIWPVITGKASAVPQLTYWKSFEGNVQAYLYGYLDVVSELSKALTDELSKPDITTEYEFNLFERYLAIADSITLRLSQERHIPGYIISNGFGRWMAYSNKLRTAYGTIAHVRRELNLRRSIQRMVKNTIK